MGSFNKVFLMGNVTRDIELNRTQKGTAVGKMGLAINSSYKSKEGKTVEEVAFVDVTLWGKTAENCEKHLSKGSSVFVEGKLKTDEWNDKQSGDKRTKLNVVAENVQFMSRPQKEKEEWKPNERQESASQDEDDVPF